MVPLSMVPLNEPPQWSPHERFEHRQRLTIPPAEEHHITTFDSTSFFTLHDYDGNLVWDGEEIIKTYGLKDESAKDVPQSKRDDVVREVLGLIDADNDGLVSKEEWRLFVEGGGKLPDLGTGPGHHGDDEWEYEIHHFEK